MHIDEEYFKSDEFKELLEKYMESTENGSSLFMDVDEMVDLADYFNWKGKDKEADDVIDYALYLYPDAALPNVFKARRALEKKDYAKARAYAEQIGNHDDPDYHYLIAEIMICEGNINGADCYLVEYGKTIDPDEQDDFLRDCANLFIDYNVRNKALEWIIRCHEDKSEDYRDLLGRALLTQGYYTEAERIFNELLDKHPFSTDYWNALASAQIMGSAYSDAITSSEYAIAINPKDSEGFVNKANALYHLENYEEAAKYYQRYAEMEPDDESALLYQGACLVNIGRNKEAVKLLERALKLAPESSQYLPQICQDLALAYGMCHRVKSAMDMLDKTKNMSCDHIDMLVMRGYILLYNQHVEEAEEVFNEAVRRSGNSPAVMLAVITTFLDTHYLGICYDMLKEFLTMTQKNYPEFTGGNAYMALCCYDLNLTYEFMKYLQIAVERNPEEARLALSWLFPEEMPVSEYVNYMENKLGEGR